MSNHTPFRFRDWLVPPIVVPILLGLVIVTSIILRW